MKLRARIVGARRVASRLLRGAEQIERTVEQELVGLARSHTRIMRSVAPRRSGALAGEIRPQPYGSGYQVVSPVRSPDGFAYTRVTRFGHNVAWIFPRGRALRFTVGGSTVFASRVRGYRPGEDWVDRGIPAAEAEAERAASRIGRRVVAAL